MLQARFCQCKPCRYTELTSACVTGLVAFRRHFPAHQPAEVAAMIDAGVEFVRRQQRDDGSWYGSWAVCFTYGCWFGVEALVAGGDPSGKDAAALERCCAFLLSKQRDDGGWGESYVSCTVKEYTQIDSTAVNTAWALMALIRAGCRDAAAIRRGVDFLIATQTEDGDWRQEWISGIFNRSCGITYTAYRNVFPLWALALYVNHYPYRTHAAISSVATAAPGITSSSSSAARTKPTTLAGSPVNGHTALANGRKRSVSPGSRRSASKPKPAGADKLSGGGSARKRRSSPSGR